MNFIEEKEIHLQETIHKLKKARDEAIHDAATYEMDLHAARRAIATAKAEAMDEASAMLLIEGVRDESIVLLENRAEEYRKEAGG